MALTKEVKEFLGSLKLGVDAAVQHALEARKATEEGLQRFEDFNAKADARFDEFAQKVIVTKWTAFGFAVWTLACIAFGAWVL